MKKNERSRREEKKQHENNEKLNKLWIEPLPNRDKVVLHGLDGSRYHYDGAWWRHEAPSAA